MPRTVPLEKVIAQAERIVRVWEDNPDFSLGQITLPQLKQTIANVRTKRDQIEALRTQLTGLANDLQALGQALNQVNTRALSGLRAVYGPDSNQYEQGGGTRTSERKRPTTKKKKPQ